MTVATVRFQAFAPSVPIANKINDQTTIVIKGNVNLCLAKGLLTALLTLLSSSSTVDDAFVLLCSSSATVKSVFISSSGSTVWACWPWNLWSSSAESAGIVLVPTRLDEIAFFWSSTLMETPWGSVYFIFTFSSWFYMFMFSDIFNKQL